MLLGILSKDLMRKHMTVSSPHSYRILTTLAVASEKLPIVSTCYGKILEFKGLATFHHLMRASSWAQW